MRCVTQTRLMALLTGSECLIRHTLHAYALPPGLHFTSSRGSARTRSYSRDSSGWLPLRSHQQQLLLLCTSSVPCSTPGHAECSTTGNIPRHGSKQQHHLGVHTLRTVQWALPGHTRRRCSGVSTQGAGSRGALPSTCCRSSHNNNRSGACSSSSSSSSTNNTGNGSDSRRSSQVHSLLGYSFHNAELLCQACDRSNAAAQLKCAQLAYVGDAALWLLFSEHMFVAHPREDPVR